MIVKTECEIRAYESDGQELTGLVVPLMLVRSHWNYESRVVIEMGGVKFTFVAAELIDAVRRCSR